ncbi:MAG TPA: hypothetical protein VHL10_03140 [Nitrososphaera sp.]|jgi:hypothetical protein|nr:hypothetical protein [Nitrososphaera sp.]
MRRYTKILPHVLLTMILAMTVVATAYQSQNALAADQLTLLNDNSRTWKGTSSGYHSPDGKWTIVHPGHGYAAVVSSNGHKIMQLRPEIYDSSRHSTLVTARQVDWKGIHGVMSVRLDKQSSNPKSWDSFWPMLAYVDQTTHITLLIKSDGGGWMISKRDHDHAGQDLHEVLASGHTYFNSVVKGHWYKVEWWVYPHGDNLHIKVIVDGHTLMNKDDPGHWDRNGHKGSGTSSYFLNAAKTIGTYSEKSYTSWKDIRVDKLA